MVTAFVYTTGIFPKRLHGFVNGSGNNVILLFLREFNEVNCIAGNTDGKLRILFRMRLRVQKSFTIEYVNVEVVTTVANVTVQHSNQIIYSLRHNIISFIFIVFALGTPTPLCVGGNRSHLKISLLYQAMRA